ncbi:MAG: class F sortase [Dehalococcoidia bacterium]
MKRAFALALSTAGLALVGASLVLAADPPKPDLKHRSYAPQITRAEAPASTPTAPAPTPTPYIGPVSSIYLASGGVTNNAPIETRDVTNKPSGPAFQEPSHPSRIAWYSNYGLPGWRGNNSIFSAHINYVNYGNGPFAKLTSAVAGDALYVTMANGTVYTYTVKSMNVVHLNQLDMNGVVFPALDSNTERITLISCGGTFVPLPGGGQYDSRIILVAERYVP